MTLSGKTATITGSNSGIGLGIAWELARAGAPVKALRDVYDQVIATNA